MEKKYKLSITPLLRYWKGGGGVVVFDSQPSVRSVLSASKRGGKAYQALVIVAKDGSLANPDKLVLLSGTFVQIDEIDEEVQPDVMALSAGSEENMANSIVMDSEPMIQDIEDDIDADMPESDDKGVPVSADVDADVDTDVDADVDADADVRPDESGIQEAEVNVVERSPGSEGADINVNIDEMSFNF